MLTASAFVSPAPLPNFVIKVIKIGLRAVVHLYNPVLHHCKQEGTLTLCDSMNRPGEHHAKRNEPVRERQVQYNFPHMWNLMNEIN